MQFVNKTEILIRNSQNNFSLFNFDKCFVCYDLDSNFNKLSSSNILDGDYSFADIYLDINVSDVIYGIINDKNGKLNTISINNNINTITNILKYDYKNFLIKFPYIKDFTDERHVFFYSISKYNSNVYYLNHIYTKNNISRKYRFDLIDYNIISNFVVIWNHNTPTIFYYKLINGSEELFVSTFDNNSLEWSDSYQITNTKKSKIYLSILKCANNYFHIVFSENNYNKYYCKYIKGYFRDGYFNIILSKYLSSGSMSLFPHLIAHNSKLYAQWVEYYTLYTCVSEDFGENWSKPILYNPTSLSYITRYEFKSNYLKDKSYNLSTFYSHGPLTNIDNILYKY